MFDIMCVYDSALEDEWLLWTKTFADTGPASTLHLPEQILNFA